MIADGDAMFRTLFDESRLAIVVHGSEGRAVAANQAFADLLGYELEEARLLTADDVIHPDDRAVGDAETDELLVGTREQAVLHRRLVRKDGSVVRTRVRKSSARIGDEPVVIILIEEANPVADLEYAAQHDFLTGLRNRRGLLGQLAHRYPATDLLLAMVDVDDLKMINDAFGHAAGDALLGAVADRLMAAAGGSAVVARWAGDEFVVCVPARDSGGPIRWEALAEKLRGGVAVPMHLPGVPGEVVPQVSVGVTMFHSGEDVFEVALRRADSRMYRAKQR